MAGKWWLPRWWLYRPIMRLAHRFNWHWCPPCYPDRDTLLRCEWCGLSYLVPKRSAPTVSAPPEAVTDKAGAVTSPRKAELMRDWPKGCPPPKNYAAWHDWSAAQNFHGQRQVQCKSCQLWRFPQELNDGACWIHAGKAGA